MSVIIECFLETPLSGYQLSIIDKNQANVLVESILSVGAILVVWSRKIKFNYLFDKDVGIIKNTSNTYFQILAKQGCSGSDGKMESIYFKLGDTYKIETLKGENEEFIIYNQVYYRIGKRCFKNQELSVV